MIESEKLYGEKKKTSRVSVTRNINCGADKLHGDADTHGKACRKLRE